jgi:miniconductance mechanosensitive channel
MGKLKQDSDRLPHLAQSALNLLPRRYTTIISQKKLHFLRVLIEQLLEWLSQHPVLFELAKVVFVLLISLIAFWLTEFVLFRLVRRLVKRTPTQIDDVLVSLKFLDRVAYVVPLVVIDKFAYLFEYIEEPIKRVTDALIVVALLSAANYVIDSVVAVLLSIEKYKGRPLKSYGQIIKIVLIIFGIIIIIGLLTAESPWVLLGGLSAMTAVLLLIFRDTILSFVASLKIASYDLIKVGDWIEVPQFEADGDVIDISLNVVKVQNWDKTITSIPTYKLIDNAFKNWRGMQESGGRRISRAINIDVNSIRFCDQQMLEKYSAVPLLDQYFSRIEQSELLRLDTDQDAKVLLEQGRGVTNIGVFRAYVEAYLRSRNDISSRLTFLVRQLAPSQYGVPIQIYVFTDTTVWAEYEAIQAEIFDFIIAAVPFFDLRIYQQPAGSDLKDITLS